MPKIQFWSEKQIPIDDFSASTGSAKSVCGNGLTHFCKAPMQDCMPSAVKVAG